MMCVYAPFKKHYYNFSAEEKKYMLHFSFPAENMSVNEKEKTTVIVKTYNRIDNSTHNHETCPICYVRPGMPLVPPLNFAMIASGVYRSGHPNKQNFAFLRKLRLKTIL